MIKKHAKGKENKSQQQNAARAHKISKSAVLDEVVRFFVNEMIPLKKVESPHLK